MSCIKENECFDSKVFLKMYVDYDSCGEVTLEEFEEILEENKICLWNYPLTEIDHIIENDIDVVLVRFPEMDASGYEYRFCEIPKDDEE